MSINLPKDNTLQTWLRLMYKTWPLSKFLPVYTFIHSITCTHTFLNNVDLFIIFIYGNCYQIANKRKENTELESPW